MYVRSHRVPSSCFPFPSLSKGKNEPSPQSNSFFFAVCDGHGGDQAAAFAAARMPLILAESESFARGCMGDALIESFEQTDQQFLASGKSSGCCCVAALISGGGLYVANAGDCRAVLFRGGVAQSLTQDHKPDRPDEKARIIAAGGNVMHIGCWRVSRPNCAVLLAASRGWSRLPSGWLHLTRFRCRRPNL